MICLNTFWASLVAQMVKHPPAIQKTWVRSLGQEDLLEKGMATHSSILAWRIPWTGSLAGYSPWDRKESDTIEVTEYTHKQDCLNFGSSLFHILEYCLIY